MILQLLKTLTTLSNEELQVPDIAWPYLLSAAINDIVILPVGTVRALLSIIPGGTVTINRVELYNSDGKLWAHQDVSITVSTGQTGVLYWFDFTITEGEV